MADNIYDVLKMQKENMEKLIDSKEKHITSEREINKVARKDLDESEKKLQENIEFVKSLGISLDDELSEAKKRADEEANFIIEEINKTQIVYEKYDITYDDLVERAHSQGYVNTQLEDLLTEREIKRADIRFENIEKEFKKDTQLTKTDIVFLVTAVTLQVVRQYVLDPMLKKNRDKAKGNDEKAHGNKEPGWYRVPTDKILLNKVPFDTNRYSDNSTIKGFLKGQKNHRDVTLGHDPFLGWVFGTANIMTGTITNYTFNSAHVKYVPGKGNVIHSKADTIKIFSTILDRVLNEGMDGKLALAYALIREGIHLKSDIGTKHSLPLPGINVLNPTLGAKLLEYGIDTASVGTEASISILINLMISMIHRMIKPEEEDEKLYAVRTRKILLISNSIASASNLIAVGIAAGIGIAGEDPEVVKKSISYLDVGGLLVTITRLFSDIRFITKIKEEFINSKLDKQLLDELENLDKY